MEPHSSDDWVYRLISCDRSNSLHICCSQVPQQVLGCEIRGNNLFHHLHITLKGHCHSSFAVFTKLITGWKIKAGAWLKDSTFLINQKDNIISILLRETVHMEIRGFFGIHCIQTWKQENGLNPGVTYLDWKWSSGWLESWEGLLLATDILTAYTEAILQSRFWRWLLHRLLKCQLPTRVLLRTPFTDDHFQSNWKMLANFFKFQSMPLWAVDDTNWIQCTNNVLVVRVFITILRIFTPLKFQLYGICDTTLYELFTLHVTPIIIESQPHLEQKFCPLHFFLQLSKIYTF